MDAQNLMTEERATEEGRRERGTREVEVWTITSPEEFARSTDRRPRPTPLSMPVCPRTFLCVVPNAHLSARDRLPSGAECLVVRERRDGRIGRR